MGCDFFWEGHVGDLNEQERAVGLFASFFDHQAIPAVRIEPRPGVLLGARIFRGRTVPDQELSCHFSFYGIAPHFHEPLVRGQGQLVFDRSRGGRIVSLWLAPGMSLEADEEAALAEERERGREVVLAEWGNTRLCDRYQSFALLLHMLQRRHCADLRVSDDFGVFERVGRDLLEFGVEPFLLQAGVSFRDACTLLEVALFEERAMTRERAERVLADDYEARAPVTEEPELDPKYARASQHLRRDPLDLTLAEKLTPISDLGGSLRLQRVLGDLQIATLGDLITRDPPRVGEHKYLGQTTLNELRDRLRDRGLGLRPE